MSEPPNKDSVKINKPPILIKQTQALIEQIEKKLDGPLLVYWSSRNGSVCHNDVAAFYEVLKHIGDQDHLYLFIKSSGGSPQAALRIVNLIRRYAKKITALVPLECASAATMMSMGSEKIQMGPLAYLTAVDTSLTHDLSPVDKNNYSVSVSQDELNRVLKLWKERATETDQNPYHTLYEHIHPLVFGAIDRSSSLSIKICEEILSYHIKEKKERSRISKTLNSDYPSHSYPITLREAQRIGLNVSPLDDEVGNLLVSMNEIYSEMGQQALTDYDEVNYHDHEILNIVEGAKLQFNYQNDKDWHYRKEERRWVPMNDQSSWHRYELAKGRPKHSRFHIR
ncbi:MAG: hypothetical protein HKN23_02555 [Verrucomicrobiales bacterium]|nr:hypothetical protein [Verrucomicrobiales bacterium]